MAQGILVESYMDQGMLIGAAINLIWVANGERGRRARKKNRKIIFIRHIKFRKIFACI
jgi:hypothetical protein